MCIRDSLRSADLLAGMDHPAFGAYRADTVGQGADVVDLEFDGGAVSYTHLRAHETVLDLVCRLLLAKKNRESTNTIMY